MVLVDGVLGGRQGWQMRLVAGGQGWQTESGLDLESGSGERRHCRFLAKILDKINRVPLLFVYFIPVGVASFAPDSLFLSPIRLF